MVTKVASEFEELLNGYLNLAKINRVELAQILGISKSNLSNKLAGTRKFSAAELHRLVSFFTENRVFTKLEQVEQLVALGGLPLGQVFTEADWHQEPLSRFLKDVKKLSNSSQKKSSNIPNPLTGIVGRDHQIDTITNLLRGKIRLLTITGPGGVGKTRISIEAARSLNDYYKDGVWWVNLASVNTAPLMLLSISKVFGLADQAGKTTIDSLKDYLADKQCLLVLDNFEQLVETEAAENITELLLATPGLKILVTSRILLRVYGEYEFVLTPLTLPEPLKLPELKFLTAFSAVELFLERAQAVDPFFSLSESNAGAVAKICERLDGLPLAIELAVAGLKFMPVSNLLKQIEAQSVGSALAVRPRNLPERHQSLQGVFDWSYQLLSGDERIFLEELAVFRGSFSVEAVCAVTGVLEPQAFLLLTKLVDASWIKPVSVELEPGLEADEADTTKATTRFSMLQITQEYIFEKLKQNSRLDKLSSAWTHYFLELAELAEPQLRTGKQLYWLNRLEADHNNFRAVLAWSIDNSKEVALKLGSALGRFWQLRGYLNEGYEWLSNIIKASDVGNVPSLLKAKALQKMALLALYKSDFDNAEGLYNQCLEEYRKGDHLQGLAESYKGLGVLAYYKADYDKATFYYEAGLEAQHKLPDRQGVDDFLSNLSVIAIRRGNYEYAENLINQSLQIRRELNYQKGIADSLINLAILYEYQCNFPKSIEVAQEALKISQDLGYMAGIGLSQQHIGSAHYRLKNYEEALLWDDQSLLTLKNLGDEWGYSSTLFNKSQVFCALGQIDEARKITEQLIKKSLEQTDLDSVLTRFIGFVEILFLEGDYPSAVKLLGIIETLSQKLKISIPTIDVLELEKLSHQLKARLRDFEQLLEIGRIMDIEEGSALVLKNKKG